jgi:VanZ family protein
MARLNNPKIRLIYVIFSLLAPLVWMGLIFYFSAEGHTASSGRSLPLATWLGLPEWLIRKLAHFAAYFILGALVTHACLAIKSSLHPRHPATPPHRYILPIVTCVLYAAFDEWHQSWHPERSPLLTDVLLDSTASLIGIFVLYYVYEKIASRRHHRPH